jgi:malate/lactate dehydrogenase
VQISPYVSELALYDIAGTPGVAADISHINSRAITKVTFTMKRVAFNSFSQERDLAFDATAASAVIDSCKC